MELKTEYTYYKSGLYEVNLLDMNPKSIAVLSFYKYDFQARVRIFSDGITEEIMTAISQAQ